MDYPIENITEEIKRECISSDALRAEKRGPNVLILFHIKPRKRLDKKFATYLIEWRWYDHSEQNVHSCAGSDYTLFMRKELQEYFKQGKNLFDFLRLWG